MFTKNIRDKFLVNVLLFFGRRTRSQRRSSYRKCTREITVRSRRICSYAISKPTNQIRKASPSFAFSTYRECRNDRTIIFRSFGRKNADRDTYPGHAPVGGILRMAVSPRTITMTWKTQWTGGNSTGIKATMDERVVLGNRGIHFPQIAFFGSGFGHVLNLLMCVRYESYICHDKKS